MKYKHTVSYRENGTGPVLEQEVIAESRNMAEAQFLNAFPTARIEKILTTVPAA